VRGNRVKHVIAEGGIALGTPVGSFQGPTMPELIGLAGFDAAVIDLEHGAFDLQQVQVLVMACELAGITPIVRVPELEPPLITRLLDIGVQGIQLSGVTSAAEAVELVRAVRFPPHGVRGLIGNSRALGYGGVANAAGLDAVNREILVKVTIESKEGLDAVEAIAAVDGIDLLGVGPNDLSAALGVIGQPNSPLLADAMRRVADAARSTGLRKLSFSIGHPAYPLGPREIAELGVAFVPCQPFPERRMLASLSEQVSSIRSELP
jgi:2-keto-3-deoxy-L-rhamnonate aldolase RhmA